ncbi:hypothetical protein FWF89_03870 [Candidatus Saccharibacteria bacterium]|nr:hypothetical protein [Candidatus Saccharibacteria bacterium]
MFKNEQLPPDRIQKIEAQIDILKARNEIFSEQIASNNVQINQLEALKRFSHFILFAPVANWVCKLLDDWRGQSQLNPEQLSELRAALRLDPYCCTKEGTDEVRCYFDNFELGIFDDGPRLHIYPNIILGLTDSYEGWGAGDETITLRSFLDGYREMPEQVGIGMQTIWQILIPTEEE